MKTNKVKISTKSGKNISAIINSPEKESNHLAILCPGNLDTKDYTHLKKLAEVLAGMGYTVVRFDPTGTWESDGEPSDYSTSQYLEDIKNVIEYMLSQKPYTEIVLGGHSRGAMTSILYAAKDKRISKVIAIMPPSPLLEEELQEEKYSNWKKNDFNISARDIPGSEEKREFKLPYSHLLERLNFNVIEDVQKVHIPIIFIAGEDDQITPPEDIKEIFDKANEPKKYILIPGIGHDYRFNLLEINMVNEAVIKALATI